MAVGAAGGVRIPNSMFDMLAHYLLGEHRMDLAVAAPRLQSTGTLDLAIEPDWPKEQAQYLKEIGFKVQTWENSAALSAVSFAPESGQCRGVVRGAAVLGMDIRD